MRSTHLNENGLAHDGFDVTEYFKGAAKRGTAEFHSEHEGAVYHFATAENKMAFDADPTAYLPQYNGWCATAASENKYYYSNPEAFVIQDDKLFLFFADDKEDTRTEWNTNPDKRKSDADTNWSANNLSDENLVLK